MAIDFFVSYTHTDRPWAEWIVWRLEHAGYRTIAQFRDFPPGSNFILEMQNAAEKPKRTIAVLSEAYFRSKFTQPEFAAALAQDPTGLNRKLLPVRISPCQPQGLLRGIV